jgi:hypothetical protein
MELNSRIGSPVRLLFYTVWLKADFFRVYTM